MSESETGSLKESELKGMNSGSSEESSSTTKAGDVQPAVSSPRVLGKIETLAQGGKSQSTSPIAQVVVQPRQPVEISVATLLESGAHFGHQTERWNPKMLPFLFGQRSGVHIINLDFTLRAWQKARVAISKMAAEGGTVLFVGTKIQARDIVGEEATRCGAHYVTTRWLGGTLTNFSTIRKSIERMKKLEDLLSQAEDETSGVKLNKKEKLTLSRQLRRLDASIGGVRSMRRIPDLLVVLDVNKEHIAIAEARRLGIPIVGLVDSNSDPEAVDFPIPCNDDSARTLALLVRAMADAIMEGRKLFETRTPSTSDDQSFEGRIQRVRGGGRDKNAPASGGGDAVTADAPAGA